jgi:hypothetical protein
MCSNIFSVIGGHVRRRRREGEKRIVLLVEDNIH